MNYKASPPKYLEATGKAEWLRLMSLTGQLEELAPLCDEAAKVWQEMRGLDASAHPVIIERTAATGMKIQGENPAFTATLKLRGQYCAMLRKLGLTAEAKRETPEDEENPFAAVAARGLMA